MKKVMERQRQIGMLPLLPINKLQTKHGVMHLVQDTDESWLIMSDNDMNFGCVTNKDMQKFCTNRVFRDKFIDNALTF